MYHPWLVQKSFALLDADFVGPVTEYSSNVWYIADLNFHPQLPYMLYMMEHVGNQVRSPLSSRPFEDF